MTTTNRQTTEPQTFIGDSPIPETSEPVAPSGSAWEAPPGPIEGTDPNAAPASPFGQAWASIRSVADQAMQRFNGLNPTARTGLGVAAGAAALAAVGGAAYVASRGMRGAPAPGIGFPFFGGGGGASPFFKKVVKPHAKPFMKPFAKPYGKPMAAPFFQKAMGGWGKGK
jgi:hypothetical protein